MLPAVVKYVFNAATVPANVRAVAVPATVIPVPAFPVTVPSLTESVTVSVALSTSAKGVPENVRLPATSSVNAKLDGAVTVGASFTAVIVIVPVPVLLEYAVLPPFVVTAAVPPAVPLVWSHA